MICIQNTCIQTVDSWLTSITSITITCIRLLFNYFVNTQWIRSNLKKSWLSNEIKIQMKTTNKCFIRSVALVIIRWRSLPWKLNKFTPATLEKINIQSLHISMRRFVPHRPTFLFTNVCQFMLEIIVIFAKLWNNNAGDNPFKIPEKISQFGFLKIKFKKNYW